MAIVLGLLAQEEAAYKVRVWFKDQDGGALVPSTLKWTLTTAAGEVVNERLDVEVETPASQLLIVLSEDDLALSETPGERETRIITIEGTYSDSDAGETLPFKREVMFEVENLVKV